MKAIYLSLVACIFHLLANAQARYSAVIDEIMADPNPAVGLPASEWLELKNTSDFPLDLRGWRIGDPNGQSGPMPSFVLQPDSFVIICGGASLAAMSVYGKCLVVTSFPSLDNDNDQLWLLAEDGNIIHAVHYSSDWYGNELKKQGGWTLEMIDTNNPCTGRNNWRASTSPFSGTPGSINSINSINHDLDPPQLLKAYTPDGIKIIAVFDEPLDSARAADLNHYQIDGNRQFIAATPLSPFFDQVELQLNESLVSNTIYTLSSIAATDCKNNTAGSSIKTGLAVDASPGDLVINEILFNPRPNAYDYIEFYNRSNNILDASKLYIANRAANGQISSTTALSTTPDYIFPGEYGVVTEDAANLGLHYLVKNQAAVFVVQNIPSFPDQEGTVIGLNAQGEILDELSYKDDWQFPLIIQPEGVALERIDPLAASQNPDNWMSAASTAGYGTPGYKNSQYKNAIASGASVEIIPTTFSPDNDGTDDIASIHYRVESPGYTANITIFDVAGRPVRQLIRNGTMSSSGYWNWNGLGDAGQKLPVGPYIVFTSIFSLQGKRQQFKNTLILARRLR